MPREHQLKIPSWNVAVLEGLTSQRRDAHGTRVVQEWYESGTKIEVRTNVLRKWYERFAADAIAVRRLSLSK